MSRCVKQWLCQSNWKKFQCSMTKKEQYLAFYVRKNISVSFDAKTTSPVESMNSSIFKNGMGVTSNANTRWVGRWLFIKHEFIYNMNLCIILCINHEFINYMNLCIIRIHVIYEFVSLSSMQCVVHRQFQTSSLSSKLSACDDIVSECLNICNQTLTKERI